jgi:hypothetical protein
MDSSDVSDLTQPPIDPIITKCHLHFENDIAAPSKHQQHHLVAVTAVFSPAAHLRSLPAPNNFGALEMPRYWDFCRVILSQRL